MADTTPETTDARQSRRAKAAKAVGDARAKAGKAVDDARAKARQARDRARESSRSARTKAANSLEQNPIAALAGGLAIGVIAAAILPRTAREDKVLGATGKRIRSTAKSAAKAAQAAGKKELDGLGVNTDSAKKELKSLLGKVGVAARSAGNAAAGSVKDSRKRKKK